MKSPSVSDMLTRRNWSKHVFYEWKLLRWIAGLRLQGVYVDVGANLGNHSIFFMNCCPCTKLVAIEAVPEIYHIMAENVAANTPENVKVELFNYAAYSRGGCIGLWDALDRNNLGATTLTIRPRNEHDTYPAKPPRSINTARIDDLVKRTDRVVVLKMDIQGGEPDAIIGSAETISRGFPLLIVEAETEENRTQIDEMLWTSFGYVRLTAVPKKKTYQWWHKDYAERSKLGYHPPD